MTTCTSFTGVIEGTTAPNSITLSLPPGEQFLAGILADYRISFIENTTGHAMPAGGALSSSANYAAVGSVPEGTHVTYLVHRADFGPIVGSAIIRATDTLSGDYWDVLISCGPQQVPSELGFGWAVHTQAVQPPPNEVGNGWSVQQLIPQTPPDKVGNGWAVGRRAIQTPPDEVGNGWTVNTFYVSSVDPPGTGPVLTGTPITIRGVGFTGVEGVWFTDLPGFPDFAAATSVVVVSDTEITCVTPDTVASAVIAGIQVYKPGLSGYLYTFVTELSVFRFVAPFAITSFSPTEGPPEGGQTVTVTGTGFTGMGVNEVFLDGVAHTLFGLTDTQFQFVTLPHVPGSVLFAASNLSVGAPYTGSPTLYRFIPTATITGITNSTEPGGAARSPIAGSGATQVLTITGTGFTGLYEIVFHPAGYPLGPSVDSSGFTVVDDNTITCRVPAYPASLTMQLDIRAPGGTAIPVPETADNFRYYAPLTVTDCEPEFGPKAGGTFVTITGTGFYGATTVEFDGVPVVSFAVLDDETITTITPPHPAFANVQIGVETDIE